MNQTTDVHPSSAELAEFAQGRIKGQRLFELEIHVQECDQCCAQLANAPGDKLTDRLSQLELVDQPTGSISIELLPDLGEDSRYTIVALLGEGGMGFVYKARHKVMRRNVAIKTIRPELLNHAEAVKRFAKEVKAAARLSHPNIVAAYDAERAGDLHYLVMEFVDGESLNELVNRQGPLPVADALDYILQAAGALQHAHQQGMVHRDIKPQNLMRTPDGTVKVLDFGLAKFRRDQQTTAEIESVIEEETMLTLDNTRLGTKGYIAPEQARDAKTADIRSDLFSLGCTLFFLLTNRPPFMGLPPGDPQTIPAITQFRQDLPPPLIDVLQRMLQYDPQARYQNPEQLIADLELIDASSCSSAPRSPEIDEALSEGETSPITAPSQAIAGRHGLWGVLRKLLRANRDD